MSTSECGPWGTGPEQEFAVTAAGAGSWSRKRCRGQQFHSPGRSLRIPLALAEDFVTRCRAESLVAREDAVFWGPTAAVLLGLPIPYRLEAEGIRILVPAGRPRPRREGVRPRQADIVPSEIVVMDGLRVTSAARTFVDLAAELWLPDLVAVGDAALRAHRVPPEEIHAVIVRRLRYSGKVRARQALPLLNAASESPQESRLRVHVITEGLPVPQVNLVVRDALGGFIARCDLGYDEWKIVIEYDGADHATPERQASDAARRSLLREHGWYVVEVVAADLRNRERAISRIRAALRSRGAL